MLQCPVPPIPVPTSLSVPPFPAPTSLPGSPILSPTPLPGSPHPGPDPSARAPHPNPGRSWLSCLVERQPPSLDCEARVDGVWGCLGHCYVASTTQLRAVHSVGSSMCVERGTGNGARGWGWVAEIAVAAEGLDLPAGSRTAGWMRVSTNCTSGSWQPTAARSSLSTMWPPELLGEDPLAAGSR